MKSLALAWLLCALLSLAINHANAETIEAPPPAKSSLRDLFSSWHDWFEGRSGDEDADDSEAVPPSPDADVLTASDLLSDAELGKALPWRVPDFSGQTGALGWSESVFVPPPGLMSRVAFWRDIYTKYSSDQGVLHDKFYFDIIYEVIDFGPIMRNPAKNIFQKAKLREKLVKDRRKYFLSRLQYLEGRTSPAGLSADDLRIWKMFEGISDPHKFAQAAGKNRVRFQLGQRDRFMIGIYYSGRYLKEMEKIFREERLPIELTRLPFVESSFNIRARSRVGASGIWQFMRRTGRSFVKVGRDIDERNDPLKATRASARLLKQNFQIFGNWGLALTAYNHGTYGINRVTRQLGTRDISQIVGHYSSKRFGFASENFYACFLAALDAETNAGKYFGEVRWGRPMEALELRLKRPMAYKTLGEFFDGDTMQTELANPHVNESVRRGKAMIPKGSYVRVPQGRLNLAEAFTNGKITAIELGVELKRAPLELQPPVEDAKSSGPQPPPEPLSRPNAGESE